ncbi:Lipid A export ATP-binding/permease protein MsbA [Clostridiaceae bacterium JG1575]|nr:Lipid A export ATP-binding/permease protein MsbA [Clostridiaceae bacterium JG1575]
MIREFIRYYGPHKRLFFLDLLCAFFISATDLVFPMVTRRFIGQYIPDRNLSLILRFGVFLLLLYILRFFLDYFVNYWGHVLGVRMEYDMRKDMFEKLQRLSFSYFDDTKTGQIMSRLVNDLNEISELAHHGPEDLFISLVMLTGSFLLLMSINIPLTLILFAIIPFLVWFALIYNVRMRRSFQDLRVSQGEINATVEDSISGIRVVQSFTNEEYEQARFDVNNQEFKRLRSKSFRFLGIFGGGVNFFANLLNLVALIAGGVFVYQGRIDVADLTAYILFMGLMINPVKRLAQFVEQFQRGMAGFRRFSEVMALTADIKDTPEAKELQAVQGEVRFQDVTFHYEDHQEQVLSGINLTVSPGETIALVGPSGAGKTTLCSLIPRFYEVNEGAIFVDGQNIQGVTLKSLRQNIGIVQQDVFLFTGTIFDNIAYGKLNATEEEVIRAAKLANAHDFITEMPGGYHTQIGERGVKLSGGQKQRLSIARMFLKNPAILILDEATSSLDNQSERIIQESIEELAKGRTTFIIAHRLATIRNAQRIIVLVPGGIAEEGTHEELLAKGGVYASLYQTQGF